MKRNRWVGITRDLFERNYRILIKKCEKIGHVRIVVGMLEIGKYLKLKKLDKIK